MEKTEKRKLFSERVFDYVDNHQKKFWLSIFAIYIIFVIIFSILTIYANGGIEKNLSLLNDYPEQQYQQLEQELQNIVVENDGIYPEKLSNDSIQYDILYEEHSDYEGKYIITLTDDVTVTGTIEKNLNKKDLIIEREYKTQNEYRKSQYVSAILGTALIPVLILCFIFMILLILFLIISSIEHFIQFYKSYKAAK